jgi:hypothetical protein
MNSENGRRTPESAWALLRSGGYHQSAAGHPSLPAWVSTGRPVARFSLDEYGQPRLLLPLGAGDSIGELKGTEGLRIGITALEVDGKPIRFLDLACQSRSLETVFARLSEAIIGKVLEGIDPISASMDTIEEFRRLLILPASGIPGVHRILGLIGELHLLNRLLDSNPDAWKAWLGPAGDRHDFRAGGNAIEVKTSSRAGCNTVTIHSLDQLECPTDGTLHLVHLRVEPDPGGSFTVADLGRSVIAKASSPESVVELLSAMGCGDVEAIEWNRYRFRLVDERCFGTGAGFPRITLSTLGSTVKAGDIPRVEYDIDLSGQTGQLLDHDRFAALEKELLECLPVR